MLTIGLIDNFAIVRLGLTMILQQSLREVEIREANTLSALKLQKKERLPDLIILGNNSETSQERLDQVEEATKLYPGIPIIVYDDMIDENLIIPYFSREVKGYVVKSNIALEMVHCIQAVSAGKLFLCPVLLDVLISSLLLGSGGSKELSKRELEIARYLTEGMRTSIIAKKLGRKPSTVSTIKHNIYRKMSVKSDVELREKLKATGAARC